MINSQNSSASTTGSNLNLKNCKPTDYTFFYRNASRFSFVISAYPIHHVKTNPMTRISYLLILFFLISGLSTAVSQETLASVAESNVKSREVNSPYLEETADLLYQRRATYRGGVEAIQQIFAENLTYPKLAADYNREGTVLLRLLIDTRGDVADIQVIRKLGLGCDEEARRLAKRLTNWIPAQQGPNLVPTYFFLPVHFRLQ